MAALAQNGDNLRKKENYRGQPLPPPPPPCACSKAKGGSTHHPRHSAVVGSAPNAPFDGVSHILDSDVASPGSNGAAAERPVRCK